MSPFTTLCPWLTETLTRLETAASGSRLGHGWLIGGPRGVGKANLAYVLAGRLLEGRCGTSPPGDASARAIVAACETLAGAFDLHPDLHRVWANDERYKRDKDKEKRTIAVEQIRDVTADLALKPHVAPVKVVIIERAESMTTEAANALLKTLEEPTPDTFLFLLADRPGRLPATIRSRCQHLSLDAPSAGVTIRWLAADGLDAGVLPAGLLPKAPISAAQLLADDEKIKKSIGLWGDIDLLYEGKADPHTVAGEWHGSDPELALDCLVERLGHSIRGRLVPGHSNPVTDSGSARGDNRASRIPTEALFGALRMAEDLREQLGRGVNVELALRALLLDLDLSTSQGVNL